MNEDNDYGQFTVIDVEDNNKNSRCDITIKFNKTYHIKYKNDIENNIHTNKDDNDDDSKKPNNKNYYLENTIYSATIILAIVIFIYFG